MLIKDFENFIIENFTKEKLEIVKGKNEYGFTNIGREEVFKLGYCTNLTIESAQDATENNVDLLITHHDAWEWMSGIKEEALEILKQSNITHFFIHLPLDDAEFGNNTSILKKLGFKVIDKFSNDEGMYCGRIGEIYEPIEFEILVNKSQVETKRDTEIRINEFLNSLDKELDNNTLIVCHGFFMKIFVKELKKSGFRGQNMSIPKNGTLYLYKK